MSVRASFSLGKALSAAFGFLPKAWGGAWLALILLAALGTGSHLAGMALHCHHLHHLIHFVALILLLVLHFMAMGALYRIALFGKDARKEGLGFGGLQFAKPELRLIGATIVVNLFILVIVATLGIVFAMLFNLLGFGAGYDNTSKALCAMLARHSTPADYAVMVYIALSLIFLVFLVLKFSLFHAATVAERKMVTLNALGLSSGHAGKLFIGFVTLFVPFALIGMILLHIFAAHIRTAHLLPHVWGTYELHLVLHGLMHLLLVAVFLPLCAGFLASAYRQIVDTRG